MFVRAGWVASTAKRAKIGAAGLRVNDQVMTDEQATVSHAALVSGAGQTVAGPERS